MLSYVATAASQPELVCGEKVRLIEDHIRLIQQKWTDLKSEVAYLDRRRRRARRKEREGTSADTLQCMYRFKICCVFHLT